MTKIISFGEQYNDDASKDIIINRKGKILYNEGEIGVCFGNYFIGLSEEYRDYFGYIEQNEQTEIKQINKKNKEYVSYNILTNAIIKNNIGYIYLLRCLDVYKIGITSDYNNRITQYKTQNPFEIKEIFNVKTYGNDYIEKELCNIFKDKLYKGNERFKLSLDDIDFIKKCIFVPRKYNQDEAEENTIFLKNRETKNLSKMYGDWLFARNTLSDKSIKNYFSF